MMKSFPQTSVSHSQKGKIDCALDVFLPVSLSLIAAKSKSVRDFWQKKENLPLRPGSNIEQVASPSRCGGTSRH